MTTKNIFKCSKCKGQKVRTRTHGMICPNCKLPRTGRVEERGDREKLEKFLKKVGDCTYIPINPTTTRTVSKTVKVSPICFVDIDSEGYPIGIEIINKKK